MNELQQLANKIESDFDKGISIVGGSVCGIIAAALILMAVVSSVRLWRQQHDADDRVMKGIATAAYFVGSGVFAWAATALF